MRRRRLLTIAVPEPLDFGEAEAIAAAVQDAHRSGAPLVLGGDVQIRTHDLGPRPSVRDADASAMRARGRLLKRRGQARRAHGPLGRPGTLQAPFAAAAAAPRPPAAPTR